MKKEILIRLFKKKFPEIDIQNIEDAVNESYLIVNGVYKDRLNADSKEFNKLVYKISYNLLYHERKRLKKFQSLEEIVENGNECFLSDISSEDKIIDTLTIEKILKSLNSSEFELFHLYFIEEMKLSEIAKMKKKKSNTIVKQLQRLLLKMRNLI